jgi:hypothetical protein
VSIQLLANIEADVPAFGHDVFDLYVLDARTARTVAQLAFESIHRVGFALGRGFDAAVREIAHPAVHSFPASGALGEESVPDTLDAAADQEPARDSHAYCP